VPPNIQFKETRLLILDDDVSRRIPTQAKDLFTGRSYLTQAGEIVHRQELISGKNSRNFHPLRPKFAKLPNN
jgi:hypothetical protein